MASTSVGPNYVLDKTFLVASGNTVTGYQAIIGSAAGTCAVATDDASPYLGVAQLDPNEGISLTAGKVVRVRMLGLTKVQVAAAVTVYNRVRVVGQGLVDDANPGAAGDYWLGLAMEAGSQLSDIITIDLTNKNTQYFTS
jgi:hypothetical protein